MPELIMACAKLKAAMSNDCAVERYTIMRSVKYTHPGWVELQKKSRTKERVYGKHNESSWNIYSVI